VVIESFCCCVHKAGEIFGDAAELVKWNLCADSCDVSHYCSGDCNSWTRWKDSKNVQVLLRTRCFFLISREYVTITEFICFLVHLCVLCVLCCICAGYLSCRWIWTRFSGSTYVCMGQNTEIVGTLPKDMHCPWLRNCQLTLPRNPRGKAWVCKLIHTYGNNVIHSRDVRNGFFKFGSVSVRFW